MDLSGLIGFVLAVAFFALSSQFGNLSLAHLVHIPALLVVLTGTLAVLFLGSRVAPIYRATGLILERPHDLRRLLHQILRLADGSNQMPTHPLLVRGLPLVREGIDRAVWRPLLEAEMALQDRLYREAAAACRNTGRSAPGVGLMAGLLFAMGGLSGINSPDEVGAVLAALLNSVVYGLVIGHLILLPLAARLEEKAGHADLCGRLCLEGLAGISRGESPAALRERLSAFDRTH